MDVGRLVDGLDAQQVEAVLSPAGPLAILAPAGSGKTRVLTARIARRVLDGSADARHTLAITFTRKAAGELGRRLRRLGLRDQPTAGTFHAVAWAVLRQRWADRGERRRELLVDPGPLVSELVTSARRRPSGATPSDVAAELSWAQARLVPPARYEEEAARHGRRPPGGGAALAAFYSAYEQAKRTRRLVDFDDLLALCARDIERDPEFAAVQRWRFRHLFIDEFQDVNPLQHRLLEAWRGGRPDLCVVGDPNQAIYSWNGADAGWLSSFATHHAGATVIRLTRSYRTTPQILDAAHEVLRTGTDDAGPAPVAVRPDGPPPRVHVFADEAAEAAGIAHLLRAARIPGRRWSACAVLVRTHAQTAAVERGLRAAGIPARSRREGRLVDLPEVQAALRQGTDDVRTWLADLHVDLADRPDGPPPGVAALAAMADEFLGIEPLGRVDAFRAWLLAGGGDQSDAAQDAVDVLTFHAAKGLEWPVVVVAGVERGLVPHAGAVSRQAREEETRLAYVACTRAEETLHVTWARRRGGAKRTASPLVAHMAAASADAVAPPPSPAVRLAPRDAATEGLRAWRRSTALAAGLPEAVVCTDAALAAVVTAGPATIEELAALPEIGPIAARRLGPRMITALAGTEPTGSDP
jgi:DNA helicase-2/ATP-dependent DNA helicase PcrA